MAVIGVSGSDPDGCEQLAALVAQSLSADLIAQHSLDRLIAAEFPACPLPPKAWTHAVRLILARAAARGNAVVSDRRAGEALSKFPGALRILVSSRPPGTPGKFDLALNPAAFTTAQMLEIVETCIRARGLTDRGPLTMADQADIEFKARLQLSKHGIAPVANNCASPRKFTHPSEQLFANLLDFYRIRWEYEPRSFPLQWDKDGKVLEAFTPDFYLPEFDTYIEITTMKQSLVTKKNRKIRMLRAIYPHVNIQVFYQKDFQELVGKFGLNERIAG